MKFNAVHPGVDLRRGAIRGSSLFGLTLRSDLCWLGRHSHNSSGEIRNASKSRELMRSRANFFTTEKKAIGVENPMKYEKWSKSLELARTFRSKFCWGDITSNRMRTKSPRAAPKRRESSFGKVVSRQFKKNPSVYTARLAWKE